VNDVRNTSNSDKQLRQHAVPTLLHKFPTYFSVLHGVKIKTMHTIVPVNLQSSIDVTGVSRCPNVCPVVLSRSTYF